MKLFVIGLLLLIGCTHGPQQALYKNLQSGIKLCYMISVTSKKSVIDKSDDYYACVDRLFNIVIDEK